MTTLNPPTRPEHYHGLERSISDRVAWLQKASVARHSNAVARLARLRQAQNAQPGAVADVWDDTINLVPEEELGKGDEPSIAEVVTHTAVTLFALHRQGKCVTAHTSGVSLGTAVRTLARARAKGDAESEGVRRRFDAVLTSVDAAEATHHLRGLVLMLRDKQIPLDYGLLATDLAGLWRYRTDAVRLRWARDYRRSPSSEEPTPTDKEQS